MEFPRKVLAIRGKDNSAKYIVNNEVDFIDYLRKENYTNCYSQIFSNKQIEEATFDTVYLDIDVHEEVDEKGKPIQNDTRALLALAKLKEVLASIEKAGFKESRVYFTGRGFAVYIDFDPIKFDSRSGYKFAVRAFLMEAGIFNKLDSSVLGDVMRVSRLPNTKNGNAEGKHCVQINPKWEIMEIWKASVDCTSYSGAIEKDNRFGKRLKEIEQNGSGLFSTIEGEDIQRNPMLGADTKYKEFPPCMKYFYDELIGRGELDHNQRINLAIFLMKIWGYDKAKKVLSWANDYKEGYTDYQMSYLMNNGIKMYACKKIRQQTDKRGKCWCPVADARECGIYVDSHGWIEKILPQYHKEDLNNT